MFGQAPRNPWFSVYCFHLIRHPLAHAYLGECKLVRSHQSLDKVKTLFCDQVIQLVDDTCWSISIHEKERRTPTRGLEALTSPVAGPFIGSSLGSIRQVT